MEQATVKYEPEATSLEEIQQAVADAGYAAQPVQELGTGVDDTEVASRRPEKQQLTRKVILGAVISMCWWWVQSRR
jgi:Cu+-exporting ATPase